MINRSIIRLSIGLLAGATAIGLAQHAGHDHAKDDKMIQHTEHDAMFQECAKACGDCQRICDQCATHCAHKIGEGDKEHLATLMSCRDCATMCSACAEVCARGGTYAGIVADACDKVCELCAAACEKLPSDTHMKACAEECHRCAKSCRTMANHAPK